MFFCKKGVVRFSLDKQELLQGLNDVESFEIVNTPDIQNKGKAKTEKEPTAGLLEAINEAKTGKTKEMKNTEVYFKKLRKRANV